jgi:endo-1,4-beta-xylanase
MNKITSLLFASSVVLSLSYCSSSGKTSQPKSSVKGLKDYYKDYFPIGAAVTPRQLHGEDSALIVNHFNSLTAENAMKMGPIHPRENEYNWRDGDSIAFFAKKHGLRLRGHNLCWHAQAPSWMFTDDKGQTVTKEVLLKRLKDHITTVVNHYKDYVYGWDVVNEAIDDNDTVFYRKSQWYRICGEDFIAKAFEYAHAADPKAVLFYNEYSTENPRKREKMYQMGKKMKG